MPARRGLHRKPKKSSGGAYIDLSANPHKILPYKEALKAETKGHTVYVATESELKQYGRRARRALERADITGPNGIEHPEKHLKKREKEIIDATGDPDWARPGHEFKEGWPI